MKFRKEWKACIAAVLIAAVPMVSLGGRFMSGVEAADNLTPVVSTNIHHQDYYEGSGNSASNIKSYLYRNTADGSLTRVEAAGGTTSVFVETYDSQTYALKSRETISMELPLFGGCYIGGDYNYIIFGRENTSTAAQEVFRIVQYSRDWKQKIRSTSLSSANTNTRTPFTEGSLRFCESGNLLYIRTCHSVAAAGGGVNQTNFTLAYNKGTGEISIGNFGYIGSSYNQFIEADGNGLAAADHTPAGIIVSRYRTDGSNEVVNLLPLDNASGSGVAVGGFGVSASSYLVAYQSAGQQGGAGGVRNIYVGKVSRTDFTGASVTNTQITSFAPAGRNSASNPILLKLSDYSFVLLWEEYDLLLANKGTNILHYVMLNGEGVAQGSIQTVNGSLSDCMPIAASNRLVWYVTNSSQPQFYTLDLTVNAIISATPRPSSVPTAGVSASPSVRPTASPTARPVITPRPPRSPKPIATPRPTATPYPPYDEVTDDDSDLYNNDEVGEDNPSWDEINQGATEDHENQENKGDDDDNNNGDDYTDPVVVPSKGAHISTANAEYVVVSADSGWGTVEYFAPRTDASSVNIPSTIVVDEITYDVQSIAAGAFKGNSRITDVTIGAEVKKIGKNAFSGCASLRTVSVGSGVKTIGDKAFYNCRKLSKITLPSATAQIGKQALAGCGKLSKMTVKSSKLTLSKVGAKAFAGVPKKAVVKVPKAKRKAYEKIFRKRGLNPKIKVKKI